MTDCPITTRQFLQVENWLAFSSQAPPSGGGGEGLGAAENGWKELTIRFRDNFIVDTLTKSSMYNVPSSSGAQKHTTVFGC